MYALFDLDDTVHDKTASFKRCAEAMFDQFLLGSSVGKREFTRSFVRENCIIQPKAKVFSTLVKLFSINAELEVSMLEYFDQNFHLYSVRFDGVIEAMAFLRSQGVGIACVTNGRDFFQRNKIEALGLSEYFEVIVTSGELGVKKPDPVIFNTALVKLGASAEDCVFIGDNLKADMQPSKSLGMKTIWVDGSASVCPEFVDAKLTAYKDFENIWRAVTAPTQQ